MGVIVLDTSVLVDQLRGVSEARDALVGALERGDSLVSSVLTKVEVLAGTRARERSSVRLLLDRLAWVGVTDEIADGAGALARRYRRSHPAVGVVDFVIAATARAVDGSLWTRNVSNFPMFTNLRAPY